MWDVALIEKPESETVEALYGMSAETLNNLDQILKLAEEQGLEN